MAHDRELGIAEHRSAWEHRGVAGRALADRVAAGELRRVHSGWYIPEAEWSALYRDEQHLVRVRASAKRMSSAHIVFSHVSAAIVHGLATYRADMRRVQLTLLEGVSERSHPAVMRHRDALDARDVVEIEGMPVTSLARTVVDVARTTPVENAVSVADAALRSIAWSEKPRRYCVESAEDFRSQCRAVLQRMVGHRGVKNARWVVEFADGRAQLPGESVSRIQLHRLGFAPPRLQVPLVCADGTEFDVDFGLDDVASWGEFDGESKYIDPRYTGGRTPQEVLGDEKRREDRIRALTGRPVARWGWPHIESPTALACRLAEYGIRLPR